MERAYRTALLNYSSYEHHSIEEPAILLGGAFVVDVVEKEHEKE